MAKSEKAIFDEKELFDIVAEVQSGNDEGFSVLKKKYSPLIASAVKSFDGTAADLSEYEKEAESALLKAALKFDISQSQVSFGLFAKICIRNALISLKRKETSRKRRMERRISPLPKRSRLGFDVAGDGTTETDKLVERIMAVLSPYERMVFSHYMSDKSVTEIAEAVGKPKKSVNNAIFRIKEKVRGIDRSEELKSQ